MVIYRSREYAFHNRAAVSGIGLSLLVVVVVLAMTDVWSEAPVIGAAAAALLLACLLVPLTITVEETATGSSRDESVVVRVNLAGLGRRTIRLSEIADVERRDYRPIREFGGWGWRWSWNKQAVAYTTRGSSAVVLTLNDGQQVYLGVADEHTLVDIFRGR